MSWIAISCLLISRILKNLILTSFASVFIPFMEEQIFGGPYSAVLEVLLHNFIYGKIEKKKPHKHCEGSRK